MNLDDARAQHWRVGNKCKVAGQYQAMLGNSPLPKRQTTMLIGHTFPPVRGYKGAWYKLTDPTRHLTQ